MYSINELERELNIEEQFDREQQLRELLMQQTQQIDLPMDEARPDGDNTEAGALNDDKPSEEGAIEEEKMDVKEDSNSNEPSANKEETTTAGSNNNNTEQPGTAQPSSSSTADVEMKEAPAQ